MRLFLQSSVLSILSAVLLLHLTVQAAAERAVHQYPFPAVISVSETAVRSGPGEEYYETSRLKRGEQVEVYDETDDYLAVRPPKGSFSWISALYVEVEMPIGTNTKINPKSGILGTVVSEGLASRIGCENTEICDTVQVKLKKDEKVLLLGELETPENHASPLWYKIAPPNGEFRWIRRSDVSENINSVQPEVSAETPKKTLSGRYTAPHTLPLLLPPKLEENTAEEKIIAEAKEKQGQIIQVRFDEAEKKQTPPEPVVPPQIKKQEVKQSELPLEKIAAVSKPAYLPSEELPFDTSAFQKAFEELKDETRVVLTRPTDDWIFETLIHRGNELYEVAPSQDDLEKVYHLVETLERTRSIRKEITYRRQFKTGGLLQPAANSALNNQVLNNPATLPAAQPAAATSAYAANYSAKNYSAKTGNIAGGKGTPSDIVSALIPDDNKRTPPASSFDVAGLLGEFDPLPIGHPPFAVVNEQREIICLITPEVGMDLKPFVGQKVGINGTLGIFRKTGKLDAKHITAKGVWFVP